VKQLVRGAGRHSCSNTLLLNRSPSIDVSVVINLTKKNDQKGLHDARQSAQKTFCLEQGQHYSTEDL